MQEMMDTLSDSFEKVEETTKFQMLEDDEEGFEVMQCQYVRQKNELKKKIEQYHTQIKSITNKE